MQLFVLSRSSSGEIWWPVEFISSAVTLTCKHQISSVSHLSHQCVSDEELNLSLWIQLGLIFYIYPLEQLQPVSVERWTHRVLQQQLSCRHFPASDSEPNVCLLWIISCSSDKKKHPSEPTGNKRAQPRGNQPEPDKTTHFRLLLHKHSHIVPPVRVYSHGCCCCRASANRLHVKHMMSPGESAGDVPATTGDTEHTDICRLHSRWLQDASTFFVYSSSAANRDAHKAKG